MAVDIAQLDVSDSWKDTFRLIERAGGPDLPHLKELKFGERFSINFKVLAFFLGPFYYLAKGLWKQAVLYLLFAIVLILLLDAFGFEKVSKSVGYGVAAIYSIRANISYYRKMVLGITPWF
jgi:hypothetical protein